MKDVAIAFTAIKLRDYSSGRVIWINVNSIIAITEQGSGHALVVCDRHEFDVQGSVEEIMNIIGEMYGEDENG